jgi:hypothetical protein
VALVRLRAAQLPGACGAALQVFHGHDEPTGYSAVFRFVMEANLERKKQLVAEGRANQQKLREVNKRLAEIEATGDDFGNDACAELESEAKTLKSEIADCVAELNEIGAGGSPRPQGGSPRPKAEEEDDRGSFLGDLFSSDLFGALRSSELGTNTEVAEPGTAVGPLEVRIEKFFPGASSSVIYYEIHYTGEVSGKINQRYSEFKKLRDALRLQNKMGFAGTEFGMSTMSSDPAERQPLLQALLAAMVKAGSKFNDRRLIEDFLAIEARSSMFVFPTDEAGAGST